MKWGGNYRKLHGTRVRMLLAAPGALKRVTSLPTTVAGPGAAATQDHSSKTIAPDTVSTEAEMLLIFQTLQPRSYLLFAKCITFLWACFITLLL